MTTRSYKGNVFACRREAGTCNEKLDFDEHVDGGLLCCTVPDSTHAGQRPSARLRRMVRSTAAGRLRYARQDKSQRRHHAALCAAMMSIVNKNDEVDRAISKAKLHALLHVHTPPINVVVFHGPDREYSFSGGFPA